MTDETIDHITFKRWVTADIDSLLREYYALPDNGLGGDFHIVTEDGNVADSHVAWCTARALADGDLLGVIVGARIMALSKRQRWKLSHEGPGFYPTEAQ